MDFKDKKVLVFGSGISGIGACELLEKSGATVILFDGNEKLHEEAIRMKLPSASKAQILIGQISDEQLKELDLVVFSPGVPTDLPVVEKMKAAGIRIWGEVELAYENAKGDVLAITGTNGKTTTTSLLGEIMKCWKESVYVVGNIGNPYTQAAPKMTEESVTVAEISSFQLETIDQFHPKVSAILNITPDHLNRHHTMENYIAAKERITEGQSAEDVCVLNYEDAVLRAFGEQLKQRMHVVYFSSARALVDGLYLAGDEIWLADGGKKELVCNVKDLNLLGKHNYENVMAATAIAYSYGVPLDKIREVLVRFTAVEHRIEYVTEVDGVRYYNDSKGTNPDAAIQGIRAMDRPTCLIGGGYDKQSEYEEWIGAFDGKVKKLVLIGATAQKIADTCERMGFHEYVFADSLQEAVDICHAAAVSGDAVLLSPACASWGMFDNYEQRGRMFKDMVRALKK